MFFLFFNFPLIPIHNSFSSFILISKCTRSFDLSIPFRYSSSSALPLLAIPLTPTYRLLTRNTILGFETLKLKVRLLFMGICFHIQNIIRTYALTIGSLLHSVAIELWFQFHIALSIYCYRYYVYMYEWRFPFTYNTLFYIKSIEWKIIKGN